MKKTLTLYLLLFTQQSVFAQINENWTEVNLAVTDSQIIPRYAEFASVAGTLNSVAAGICERLDRNALGTFQLAWQTTMDAWQAIQHVQFGPITYFNWNFRLQYWPDDNNIGGRQLSVLIATQDQQILEPDVFARQSVAVQGFPALERILFAENSLTDLQSDSYRCRVAQTIAKNISEIATAVHLRWIDEFRDTVVNADEGGFFESAEDATIDFLKALVETIPRIQDQKLLPILGDSFERSRIRRAESWRAQRSLKNLKINLIILEQLFNGSGDDTVLLNSVFLADDVDAVNVGFAVIDSTLAELPDSMVPVFESEEQYAILKRLETEIDELFEYLEVALKNTDLYLGFNSLDGD